MTVVVDTGPLVAVADRDDAHHQACIAWFDQSTDTVGEPAEIKLDLPLDSHLPVSYVSQEGARLDAYRRSAECQAVAPALYHRDQAQEEVGR